jgi:hypothetical protein
MKDIRTLWKARAAAKEISSYDIAALCIYKSLRAEEDLEATKTRLRKAFTPVRSPIKLENGATPYGSLRTSLYSIKWSVFPTWLTEEELAPILERASLLAKEKF